MALLFGSFSSPQRFRISSTLRPGLEALRTITNPRKSFRYRDHPLSESPVANEVQFGEEYRPCKLKRTVLGCPRGKNQNDFMFSKSLEFKLFGVLQKHSVGKPILVFCSTRKGRRTFTSSFNSFNSIYRHVIYSRTVAEGVQRSTGKGTVVTLESTS